MGLAVVRDMREARVPAGPEELAALETDALAGFVPARVAAGLSDWTISLDVTYLEQVRAWFGRPLWEMQPTDADEYFREGAAGRGEGHPAVAGAGAEDVFHVPPFDCTSSGSLTRHQAWSAERVRRDRGHAACADRGAAVGALGEHYARPRPKRSHPAGYDPDDIKVVFGG